MLIGVFGEDYWFCVGGLCIELVFCWIEVEVFYFVDDYVVYDFGVVG